MDIPKLNVLYFGIAFALGRVAFTAVGIVWSIYISIAAGFTEGEFVQFELSTIFFQIPTIIMVDIIGGFLFGIVVAVVYNLLQSKWQRPKQQPRK